MENKRYTIKEIAELAGVSRATVDRVIHKRGKVSPDAYQKIEAVLETIDYQPNFMARALKQGKSLSIAVLMPNPEFDVYWKAADEGVERALSDLDYIGLSVKKFLFNPRKEASFIFNANQVLASGPDAVLVVPLFYKEAISFFKECESKELSYVTFNTHIDEASPLSHVGQDLKQSGRTAASLLDRYSREKDEFLLVNIEEESVNFKHVQEKEEGFRSYFEEKGFHQDKVKKLRIEELDAVERELIDFLERNSLISGIYVTTSKAHYLAAIKQAYKLAHYLIGYDLIPGNIDYLEKGFIDYLIFQNPYEQARKGIHAIADALMFGKEIDTSSLLPIDILIKENYKGYLV